MRCALHDARCMMRCGARCGARCTMRCRWAGVTCPSSRLAGMPSIAACSSGIGPTTSRRKLWSKAYLHMAGVAEACDALRRA